MRLHYVDYGGDGEAVVALHGLIQSARAFDGIAPVLVPHVRLRAGGPRSKLPDSWGLDPQRSWYERNLNICEFLELVPADQKMRVRGEDILTDPSRHLQEIAGWLNMRTDAQAIEEMKHPERSLYACFRPKNARAGNDPSFLCDPVLRPAQVKRQSIEGPLNWRLGEFLPKVKRLARGFGYQ
jgi:hypothetical protein